MVMVKLWRTVPAVLLLVALQADGASLSRRLSADTAEIVAPRCDTSIEYIDMVGLIRNTSKRPISFHLDDHRGPPFELWYMGYIVSSAAPGEEFRVVHYSGHDSEWDRTVTVAPGESATFSIPLFGLRPADYYRYFQIEVRDAKFETWRTPPFDLCAFAQPRCTCPPTDAPGAAARACPVVPIAGLAGEPLGTLGVACR
jgi:hypothetical protein